MTTKPRVSVQITADLHHRLKDEADARTLSVSRLAEILIERGLPRLPPLPDADEG